MGDPITTGLIISAAVGTASAGLSYQQGRQQAKRQKGQIAEQQRAATAKRGSLIRQQRAQLGGAGDFDIKSGASTPGGLTAQGTDEVLG